jgi:hypothetical protein
MTSPSRRSAGEILTVRGATSLGTSIAIAACALLVSLPAAHDAASAKQTTRTERPSPPRPNPAQTKPGQTASREHAPSTASPATDEVRQQEPKEPASAAREVVHEPVHEPAHEAAREAPYEAARETPSEDAAAFIVPIPGPADGESLASHFVPSAAPTPDPGMDEVNQYLWKVYQRTVRKHDGSGDFTWKDVAAAAHLGMSLGDYVIAGMDPDFRELLYHAGLAMDAAGMRWTILSAFRDDYRQGLAAGYKARIGDSLHGGSATTGGYGHGCAVDISDADGKSVPLWHWVDANTTQVGLERPLPGIDPAHIQARGPWHAFAAALRRERLAQDMPSEDVPADSELADFSADPPTSTDMLCVGLHHHRTEPLQASASPPEAVNFDATKAYVPPPPPPPPPPPLPAKLPPRSEQPHPHTPTRVATRTPVASTAETDKLQAHSKATTRSLPHHALHAPQRATRES